jgi:hypothetical protein
MMMPMTAGLEEIGEYQRMMESASAALAATHSLDADSVVAAQVSKVACFTAWHLLAASQQEEKAASRSTGGLAVHSALMPIGCSGQNKLG